MKDGVLTGDCFFRGMKQGVLPVAEFAEPPLHGLSAVPGPLQINRHAAPPDLGRHLQRFAKHRNAGVVDQHIGGPEQRFHFLNHRSHRLRVGDVATCLCLYDKHLK